MVYRNAISSRVLLSSSLLTVSCLGACSGVDWENQRLILDVVDRQTSDHSPSATTESETEHPDDAPLMPKAEFELCETSLLHHSYASDGAFWLGKSEVSPHVVDGVGYFGAFSNESGEVTYTKEVDVDVASDGTLVDANGHALLGFSRGAGGDMQCPSALRTPITCNQQPTTRVVLNVNLDPLTTISEIEPWDSPFIAPFSASFLVYDSRGASHWLSVYFHKLADSWFSYHIAVDSADLYNEGPGYQHELSGGTLAFDTNGALLDASVAYVTVDFYSATAGQLIELDFGVDITNDGGNGLGGSTSFDGPSTVTALQQDGNPSGTAVDVTIGPRGVATVECSFGGDIEIGSVVLARFPNEDELLVGRDGTFRQTTASGAPAFAPPGHPGRGLIE